jgi:hypothetical protein
MNNTEILIPQALLNILHLDICDTLAHCRDIFANHLAAIPEPLRANFTNAVTRLERSSQYLPGIITQHETNQAIAAQRRIVAAERRAKAKETPA